MTARARHYALLFIATALLLIAHSSIYYPYIADDAFISMRYAERMLQGHGLTWNDGEFVEGYSNLLWVLTTALLGFFKVNLEVAVRALGMMCALLTPLVFISHARRNNIPFFATACTCLIYALLPPVAFWAIGGLEGPMVMLFVALAATQMHALLSAYDKKRALLAGVLLGLVCLLRPEGPVYTIALITPLMVSRHIQPSIIIAGTSALFFCAQIIFRLWYYDALFANSVTAKVAFTASRFETGIAYIALSSMFFIVSLLYTIMVRRAAAWSLWPLVFPLIMIVLAGGDIFPSARAWLPLIPFIMLAFMSAAAFNLRHNDTKEKLFAGFIVAASVALLVMMPRDLKQDAWVQDAIEIGKALNEKYGEPKPLVAVHAAGAIPYYSKLPTLDVLGLMDRRLTQNRASNKEFGHGLMGHELFDADYVITRAPDILAFDIPNLGTFCGDLTPDCKKLLAHYRKQTLSIPGHEVMIWVRDIK